MLTDNSIEALTVLEQQKIALVVVALTTPEASLSFLRLKRSLGAEHKDVPVLVIADETFTNVFEEGVSLGVQAFTRRPIEMVLLRQRIHNLLQIKQAEYYKKYAEHDRATGLYSKEMFMQQAQEVVGQAGATAKFQVYCLGIKNITNLSYLFGTAAAESLFCTLAAKVDKYFRTCENTTFGRWSIDKIAILCPAQVANAEKFYAYVLQAMKEVAPKTSFYIDIVLGVADVPEPLADLGEVVDGAELATWQQRGGKSRGVFYYSQEQRQEGVRHKQFLQELPAALQNKEFELYYQPKYDLTHRKIVGAEALVRWQHPQLGLLDSERFTALFERNGVITDLDKYVCEEVFAYLHRLLEKKMPLVPISVNVSRLDIYQDDFVDFFKQQLAKYQVPVQYIELEITESAYTTDTEQLLKVAGVMRELGFRIAMDDFGKGYSSLTMLDDAPIDVLKMDIAFLQQENNNRRGAGIISFVINLGTWLKIPVVAEGIETEEQLCLLRNLGCNIGQGFLLSPPQAEAKFTTMLQERPLERMDKVPQVAANMAIVEEFMRGDTPIGSIFDSFVGPIIIVEKVKNRIRTVHGNRKFQEVFGIEALTKMLSASNILEFVYETEGLHFLRLFEQASSSFEEVTADIRCYSPLSASIKWNELKVRSIFHDQDRDFFVVAIKDVTAKKEAEIKQRMDQRCWQLVLARSDLSIWELDLRTNIFIGRSVAMHTLGLSHEVKDIFNTLLEKKLIYPQDIHKLQILQSNILFKPLRGTLELRVCPPHSAQPYIWLRLKYYPVKDIAGDVSKVVGTVENITTQKEADALNAQNISYRQEEIKRSKVFIEADVTDNIIIAIFGKQHYLEEFEGGKYSTAIAKIIQNAVHPQYLEKIKRLLSREYILHNFRHGITEGNIDYLSRNHGEGIQRYLWFNLRYSISMNTITRHLILSIFSRDINQRKIRDLRDQYLLNHDALTGVYNRRYFQREVQEQLLCMMPSDCAILTIFDLDNFKFVNDHYGHKQGDKALGLFSNILKKSFRKEDMICRLGGDEFAVFARGVDDAMLHEKFQMINEELKLAFKDWETLITCSAGVAKIPESGTEFGTLYVKADNALYKVKGNGRNGFCVSEE